MNTYMREKGHIIFTKEFQVINVEGTRRINKSPLAHTVVIAASKFYN